MAIGSTVERRFTQFAERFACVAEHRGIGAMRALELVKDRDSMEPDPARIEQLVERAARCGVLLLSAGLYGNVLRTLMPLVMTDAELNEGLDVIESCFAEFA